MSDAVKKNTNTNELRAAFEQWRAERVPDFTPDDFDRAIGRYQLAADIRRDTPALMDTLDPVKPILDTSLPPPKQQANPTNPNAAGRVIDAIVDTGKHFIENPFATAGEAVAMLPQMYAGMKAIPAFVKGASLPMAGAYVDEGIKQGGELAAHLAKNPQDTYHMLRGLGQSVSELPSRAASMGESLWTTLTEPDYSTLQPNPIRTSNSNTNAIGAPALISPTIPVER